MTAPNHILGGFTITGIFASLGGINIMTDYRLLAVIGIASLLPDIDYPKSTIGKLFYPISKAINRKYGHRTITHSLIVLIGLTALISGFQSAYFPSIKIAQVFGLAYGSHLILDMVTIQGVPLFYPFKKNPCVLPGNPHMRLRTSSIRHETMALCVFIVSAVFMKPLFADGFWTSYNRLFGSLQHIVSEFNKSEDLMKVRFNIQHGSDVAEYSGFCIAVNAKEVTILNEQNQFESYPQEGQIIKDIYPIHTMYTYTYTYNSFHDISLDSLHHLFQSGKFTKFELQGSRPFIHNTNGIKNQKSALKLDFPNQLFLEEIHNTKKVSYISNPAISTKQDQIKMYRTIQAKAEQEYNRALKEYNQVKDAMATEQDEIQKELLMIQFSKMKPPTPPGSNQDKISKLESEIQQQKIEDHQKYNQALKEAEDLPLTFSGSFTRLLINDKDI